MKLPKFLKRFNFLDIIIFLFVTLFVYAATSKLMEYDLFKAQIGKSPLIMNHSEWIAWMVPTVEIAISLAFIIPRLLLPALYSSFFLMFMFTAYIAFILTFSPYVPCSCGGILSSMGWTEHLIFNIGFTLLAVVGIVLYNRQHKQDHVTVSFN
jgi:uncharacterized membrane protein YphA (DoxX/SURF4 family)